MNTKIFSNTIPYDTIAKIAARIANCDYCTAISRYSTGNSAPWVITVGESRWRRRLVVRKVYDEGSDAQLQILSFAQSDNDVINLDVNDTDGTVTLLDLVSGSYRGVKTYLAPKAKAA